MPRETPSTPALDLRATQQLFAQAIMRPLTPSMRADPNWPGDRQNVQSAARRIAHIVVPNDRLSAFERVEIYNRQYWFRLIDSFYEDFPGLLSVVGPRRFERLAHTYLQAHPSRSFTLRDLGQFLNAFLAKSTELTIPHTQLARDVAALEWARIEAFDNAQLTPLSAGDLAALDPVRTRLRLQPHARLLHLQFPADEYLLALKQHEVEPETASNAMDERAPRAKQTRLPRPRRNAAWLVVHRHENSVYYKRIDAAAYAALTILAQPRGGTIAAACRAALPVLESANQAAAIAFQNWFATWGALGWLCLHQPAAAKQSAPPRKR